MVVDANLLRSTSDKIQANMEHAIAIAKGYLSNHENVMSPATWSGAGVVASHTTAMEVANELNKVLTGGTRLAEGLKQAAALMEHHEADSQTAFQALFGGGTQSV
ncbi:MAG: WXG100 family type VII secretion target [Mycobacterium sp.]